jgi:hypothetical protein
VSPHEKKKTKKKKEKKKRKKKKTNETEKSAKKTKSGFVSRHNLRLVSEYKKNNTYIDCEF